MSSNGNGLNRWAGFVNVAADPELRHTQGGAAVLNIRVACTTKYRSGDEDKENTAWLDVVVWGKRAEALERFIEKGAPLYIEGEIRTSTYEDKEGNKRNKWEINATEIRLLGGGKKSSNDDDEPKRGARDDDRDRGRSRGDDRDRDRGRDRGRDDSRGRDRDRDRDAGSSRSKREEAAPWD